MASVPGSSAAPSLFLRNATGLVKGWSGFDAFSYSFMSVNLVTLGMFYSLAVFAYVPGRTRSCRSSWPRSRSRSSPSPTPDSSRRCRALAATTSGRAGSLTGSRASLTGAVVGGSASISSPMRPASTSTLAIGAGIVGVIVGGIIGRLNGGIGFVLAATGWWFILAMWAPIYGAILNIEFFQPLAALVKSSDGLSFFASQNGILFVSIVTIILTSALVALGMAGYARIQKWCLYLGLDRLRDHVRADAHLEPGRLQDRLRPGQREPVRHLGRLRQDARRRRRQRRLGDDPCPDGHGHEPVGHAARDARDDPVHAVLDPVPELGLDAVRRGPRLG